MNSKVSFEYMDCYVGGGGLRLTYDNKIKLSISQLFAVTALKFDTNMPHGIKKARVRSVIICAVFLAVDNVLLVYHLLLI